MLHFLCEVLLGLFLDNIMVTSVILKQAGAWFGVNEKDLKLGGWCAQVYHAGFLGRYPTEVKFIAQDCCFMAIGKAKMLWPTSRKGKEKRATQESLCYFKSQYHYYSHYYLWGRHVFCCQTHLSWIDHTKLLNLLLSQLFNQTIYAASRITVYCQHALVCMILSLLNFIDQTHQHFENATTDL